MSYHFPDYLLVQFAKAPIEGRVKTRMQPVLSTAESVLLHKGLVDHQWRVLRESALASAELWVSEADPFFGLSFGRVHLQQGESLGDRMAAMFAEATTRASGVVLVGSDCPLIDSDYLRQALEGLQQHDLVIGPASDGGYVLIGMCSPHPEIFEGVEWGSGSVYQQTVAQIEKANLNWLALSELPDIDRPEDLPLLDSLELN